MFWTLKSPPIALWLAALALVAGGCGADESVVGAPTDISGDAGGSDGGLSDSGLADGGLDGGGGTDDTGGGTDDIGGGTDAGGSTDDAGGSTDDAGGSTDDAGQSDATTDGGSATDDAGGSTDDTGQSDAASDGGSATDDAGGSTDDAGTSDAATDDPGGSTDDAGASDAATDGGSSNDDAGSNDAADSGDGGSSTDDTVATCPGGLSCPCKVDGDCAKGFVCTEAGGKLTCEPPCKPTSPADEGCDGVDNDCDGETDESSCASGTCFVGACAAGSDGKFACQSTPKDGACDDGDACTSGDACAQALCKGGAAVTCAGDTCNAGTCDPKVGCGKAPKEGPCDDGDACTGDDACGAGACKGGAAKVCDDKNPCTIDSCDGKIGCVAAPAVDGGACDDGNACTGTGSAKDGCSNGSCAGGGPVACADGNPCTKDACLPASGCTATADDSGTCDDSNPCTEGDSCFGGGCGGKDKMCDDKNPCTKDACEKGKGCTTSPVDGGACDDGDACTESDACKGGTCAPGATKSCDDGNVCTSESCIGGSCQSKPAPNGGTCDDGNACTMEDACDNGLCTGKGKGCDDGNACTDDACDPKVGCTQTANSAPCDDANACSDNDGCKDKVCKGTEKPANACDDNNACTKDACDPKVGCQSAPSVGIACQDGDACTDKDTCDAGGKCQPGANLCECKVDGDCKDDSNLCNGKPVCKANKCQIDGASVVVCDPSKDTGCLAATCVPSNGSCELQAINEGKPCTDANPCSLGDSCAKGQCVDGGKAKCDDGDPCTNDACDSKTGDCSATKVEGCVACVDITACDDKNPCTKDACSAGICSNSPISGCTKDAQLIAVSVKPAVAKADAGAKINVAVEVKNNGQTDAGAFDVAVLLSSDLTADKADAVLTTVKLDTGLGANKSTTLNLSVVVPTTAKGAIYKVLAHVDSGDVIVEDPSDNIANADLEVVAKPDLTITTWSTDKDFYGPNTPMQLSATVLNQGAANAGGSVIRAYWSVNDTLEVGDQQIGQGQTNALAAGASQTHTATIGLPNAQNGTYTLFVVTDASLQVAEGSETNNVVSKKIQVGAVANLRITAFEAADTVTAGQELAIKVAINNNGQATSGTRNDILYLSTNSVVDADDLVLASNLRAEIAAGLTSSLSFTVKIPANVAQGGKALIYVVDTKGEVPESLESDNSAARGLAVTGLPDYVPSATLPTAVLPGTTSQAVLRVDNIGTGNGGNSVVRLYRSVDDKVDNQDTQLATSNLQGINPGQNRTANVQVSYGTTPGKYKLLLVADATAQVAEVSETNNIVVKDLKILAPADLVPKSQKLSADSVSAGAALTVNWTDANEGDDTPTGFQDGIYLSIDGQVSSADVLLGTVNSAALAAGASANRQLQVTIPASVPPGKYKVLIYADRTTLIVETSESNNVAAADVEVTAANLPDLKATNAEVLGATTTIQVGVDFDVQAIEHNSGLADAGNFQGTWYLSTDNTLGSNDTPLLSQPRSGIAAGKQVTATAKLRLPTGTTSGTRFLIYRVDSGGAVTESSEGNNLSNAVQITAQARPDLVITALQISPNFGASGTNVQVSMTVANIGGANSNNFQIRAVYSSNNLTIEPAADTYVGQTSNQNGLNAGQSRQVQINFQLPNTPAGTQVGIGAFVDSGDAILEAAENNNTAGTTFSTPGADNSKPNLFFQTAQVNDDTPTSGQTINFSTNWRNLGSKETGSWNARVVFAKSPGVLDGAVEVASSLQPTILPGATQSKNWQVTVPANLHPSLRYLTVIGDHDAKIDETIETDNTGWVTLTITPLPNLVVVSVKASTATPAVGGTVDITVVVSNAGAAAVNNAGFVIRRSNNENITPNDTDLYEASLTLAAGASQTIVRTIPVPTGLPASYYIGARLDENDVVVETTNQDNVGTVQLQPKAN